MRRFVIFVLLVLFVAQTASAGWVQLGSTHWFLWADAHGHYDGWWYLREHVHGGWQFRQHSRYNGASVEASAPRARRADASTHTSITSYAWRQQVVDILAQRQASRARIEEAAVDHAAFLETIRAAGMQLGDLPIGLPGGYGYGGGYLDEGQSTVYGATSSLADPFKNLDIDARLVGLQRLSEEVAKGTITISQETQRTLRETLAIYERLKSAEVRKEAASGVLRDLKELLHDTRPSQRSDVRDQRSEGDGAAALPLMAAEPLATLVKTKCVECHGPTKAEKGLRLDKPDVFRANHAKIVHRVYSTEPSEIMPPPGSGKTLNLGQKTAFVVGKLE